MNAASKGCALVKLAGTPQAHASKGHPLLTKGYEEHSESPGGRTKKAQVGEAATQSPRPGGSFSDILA